MLEVLRLQSDRKPKDSMGFEQEKQHQRDEEEEGNCVDSSFHTGETISSEGYNCNDPEEYGSSVVPDFPHSNVKKECPVHEDDEEEGAQQQQYDNGDDNEEDEYDPREVRIVFRQLHVDVHGLARLDRHLRRRHYYQHHHQQGQEQAERTTTNRRNSKHVRNKTKNKNDDKDNDNDEENPSIDGSHPSQGANANHQDEDDDEEESGDEEIDEMEE